MGMRNLTIVCPDCQKDFQVEKIGVKYQDVFGDLMKCKGCGFLVLTRFAKPRQESDVICVSCDCEMKEVERRVVLEFRDNAFTEPYNQGMGSKKACPKCHHEIINDFTEIVHVGNSAEEVRKFLADSAIYKYF